MKMTHAALVSTFLLMLATTCHGADGISPADAQPPPVVKDTWSEAVKGLRARLVFGAEQVVGGTRLPEVFLELHNAGSGAAPLEFTFNPAKALTFDLQNGGGAPVPKTMDVNVSGMAVGPFQITLPKGGTMRFPVSWGGYGIPPDAGTMLCFEPAVWTIPRDAPGSYFLSAKLEIARTQSVPGKADAWSGLLKIPAVKAPTKH